MPTLDARARCDVLDHGPWHAIEERQPVSTPKVMKNGRRSRFLAGFSSLKVLGACAKCALWERSLSLLMSMLRVRLFGLRSLRSVGFLMLLDTLPLISELSTV